MVRVLAAFHAFWWDAPELQGEIGEIAEDTRKGALNIEEAAHKAVKAVTKETADKVIEYFN